jgi:hypothetical protein
LVGQPNWRSIIVRVKVVFRGTFVLSWGFSCFTVSLARVMIPKPGTLMMCPELIPG